MTPMTRRKEMLAFSRPSLGDEEIAEILHSMRSGWITTGPKCARFEQDVCEYVGAKHAVALSSATAGLHLALLAAGVGPGDEVITTSMTFAATANVVALDELLSIGAEQFGQVSAVDATHQSRTNDPARTFEAKETKFLLSQAIGRLSDREKLVLTFYYFQNMTLAEIGTILGVTESRISQMHTAAMSRLRDLLVAAEHA